MSKPQILIDADRVILSCFLGIAIPHQPSLADGTYGPIRSEKVLKFNRKALRKIGKRKVEKVDPRYNGGDDTMIIKVGKPGNAERKEALAQQYAAIMASGEEVSPFSWRGDD
jgi:tRNA G37 N-methylase TrmD